MTEEEENRRERLTGKIEIKGEGERGCGRMWRHQGGVDVERERENLGVRSEHISLSEESMFPG